ncbi:histidine kinase [Halorubraceae archaeon YAN]|nr:histidine kinase [Halorubraceae archaeon YAN]
MLSSLPVQLLYQGYIVLFGLSAIACFLSLKRSLLIDDRDTRYGLFSLVLVSGLWAAAHVGYLLAPTAETQYLFYLFGLVVGFGAVGPWLYFCSAYTGRSIHRSKRIQQFAVALYLGIVSIKLTNPLHEFYFTTIPRSDPFVHLAIVHQPLHWVIMGLAYALAIVGFFMLFELFIHVGGDTRPLSILVLLTGLPVVLDVLGSVSRSILEFTYSSLGVAVFAVGVLFIFADEFKTVQLAGGYDDPVVVLNEDGTIRDYNQPATLIFPELANSIGTAVSEAVPALSSALSGPENDLIRVGDGDTQQFYQLTRTPIQSGQTSLGRIIQFIDVTEREQYRNELERQNARLEQFTGVVSHDLRNPLSIASGWVAEARESGDTTQLDRASDALDRMELLIDDLLLLAKQGRPINETEAVSTESIANNAWNMIDQGDATLTIENATTLIADPERLQQLFENLFRNAIEHGGDSVSVTVGTLSEASGFYIEDDGPGIDPADRDEIFESGFTTNPDGTGFGLSIVSEIVDAHGWQISVAESATGGARFEIQSESTTALQ